MSDYSVPRKALPGRGDTTYAASHGTESGNTDPSLKPSSARPETRPTGSHDLEAGPEMVKGHLQPPETEQQQAGRWRRMLSRSKGPTRLLKEYGGGVGIQIPSMVRYKRPDMSKSTALSRLSTHPQDDKKLRYRNKMGLLTYKHHDVPVYLSTTTYEPRRLLIQCTKQVWDAPSSGDWRQVKMKGSVPTVLKMAEWALRPADKRKIVKSNGEVHERRPALGLVVAFGRMILVGPFLQGLMALPGMTAPWEQDVETNDKYDDYPGYHWDWPEFAVNKFDMKPTRQDMEAKVDEKMAKFSAKPRQVRPTALVVYDPSTKEWTIEHEPSSDIPFVVVSFTRAHFHVDESATFKVTAEDAKMWKTELEKMCRYVARDHFEAEMPTGRKPSTRKYGYWLDYQCGSEPGASEDDMNHHINTICDVVRSAKKVIIALPQAPDRTTGQHLIWGQSLWTLSEILLASGDIKVCWPESDYPLTDGMVCHVESWSKMEMTRTFWEEEKQEEDEQPTRILAEHFSGLLSLGRIELFITALAAFEDRFSRGTYGPQELSRALMALFHHRIDNEKTESLFHCLARVNMANDNDDLIERMICWSPSAGTSKLSPLLHDIFSLYRLSFPDRFGSRLWNIRPMCEVVGLAKEENTVMIDGCRSISIRWKNFPRLQYKRSYGFKKLFAELLVRSGSAWIVAGFTIAFYYLPLYVSDGAPDFNSTNPPGTDDAGLRAALTILIVGFALVVGFILSLLGPSCVRRLYGGSVVESTARLVAFEGTMPAKEVEELIFGNFRDRLAWQPSATPLSRAESDIRIGSSPSWLVDGQEPDYQELERVRKQLDIPPNHKIFTLVDTGRLTISIFSAQYPPSVALLCGRDGGMLRAVLCSWDFKSDCLYKETVMRMPSEVWESATPKSWLKLRLTSRSPFLEL
ncbi:hypothetical protein BP5796_02793 [Coleophoma crateriformis]|uniref:Heterokaryon incompatibility domain-containing protein n=1 Tax=Coleophoma crateriformis TaxID=565419 RepID=A0A3D8T0U5_9HELO|nr:hypothetical protein BP5796_02793 [Coleophoma crateriformis]